MPSSPLARAASRQEQQAATESRIASEVKAAPAPFKTTKVNQECFAPDNVLRRTWRLNLPADIAYESLLEENEMFSGFPNLAPGQRIEVVDEGLTYIADLIVLWRSGPRIKLHELSRHELPSVDASNKEAIGGFVPIHIGAGKWKVKRLAFKKPSGNWQEERIFPNVFPSEMEAAIYIREALVGRAA